MEEVDLGMVHEKIGFIIFHSYHEPQLRELHKWVAINCRQTQFPIVIQFSCNEKSSLHNM